MDAAHMAVSGTNLWLPVIKVAVATHAACLKVVGDLAGRDRQDINLVRVHLDSSAPAA